MRGVCDRLFFVFFLVHIPITWMFDAQAIISREMYPRVLVEVMDYYTANYQDVFMKLPPVWFQSFIFCEILFQFPLLLINLYGLWKDKRWVPFSCIIYGTHVATTCIPILWEMWASQEILWENKIILTLIYSPYVLIPLLMVVRFTFWPYNSNNKDKQP